GVNLTELCPVTNAPAHDNVRAGPQSEHVTDDMRRRRPRCCKSAAMQAHASVPMDECDYGVNTVALGRLFDHGEESPGTRDAFEFVFASVLEGEPGAGDEVDNGAGDEHVAWSCLRGYSCSDVDRHAADVGAP